MAVTLLPGAESNGQDTYYGLTILSPLNANFPNIEKTVKFIDVIRLGNIYSIYYVSKASLLIGKSVDAKQKRNGWKPSSKIRKPHRRGLM